MALVVKIDQLEIRYTFQNVQVGEAFRIDRSWYLRVDDGTDNCQSDVAIKIVDPAIKHPWPTIIDFAKETKVDEICDLVEIRVGRN